MTKKPTALWSQTQSERESDSRLAEVILYIANRCKNDHSCGSTKLNKLLFFADFEAFVRLGKTITMAEYQKLPNGPAPRRLKPVRTRLIDSADATLETRPMGRYTVDHLCAQRNANMSKITQEESEILDEIIERFRSLNARELSSLSHDAIVHWDDIDVGETLSPELAFLSPESLSDEEFQYGVEAAIALEQW